MKKPYTIVPDASTPSSRELADWLAKDGQLLVPLVELLEKGERAIDEVIDVMGRATVEAVLKMSAEQVAGPKEQGRRDADRELYWHGVQAGRVALKERQLRVAKPRLRKKRPRAGESGEVEIPAYTALQGNRRLADRMLELMLHGVSTRKYEPVLPAMAEQVGISKSEVSRETIEAGTRVLQELAERDLSELDVLVVYDVGMPAQMHAAHPAGLVEMRVGPFHQLAPLPQQPFPARAANPPAVGIHRVPRRRLAVPVPPAAVRLRDVAADADGRKPDHRLVAVISLVGHHLRDPRRADRLDLLGGRDERVDQGRRCQRSFKIPHLRSSKIPHPWLITTMRRVPV